MLNPIIARSEKNAAATTYGLELEKPDIFKCAAGLFSISEVKF